MLINDPKTGDAALIDSEGNLAVASRSTPLLWDKLHAGAAFYVSTGLNCLFGGNSTGTVAGTYVASEYVVAELYNNSLSDLMVVGAEASLGKPHTLSPYTPFIDSTHDIEIRINQWLYQGQLLGTVGNNGIVSNLNRTSTEELETRSNGNKAMRWATTATAVATPGSSDPGYICGFRMSYLNRPKLLLPVEQPLIIGRGQSWVVSMHPMQNSAPTNMTFNVRASVIKL